MSDLAAIFLAVFTDSDALAFWCFERMMHAARSGFRHDECGIRQQLRQVWVPQALRPALALLLTSGCEQMS
jgi:Rab-GTPase-TBC domain